MALLTAARWGTILVLATALLGGCSKKEAPQKTEAHQAAPAPPPLPVPPEQAKTGEALFKQHCAVCHPDGGNIIKPHMTLRRDHLASHGITKPDDIVKTIRDPGPGMTKFGEKAIPEKDAKAIAGYILATFK